MSANSTNVGTIDLDLVLQSKSFQKQLDTAVNSAIKNTSKTAAGTLTSSFSKLGKVIGAVFAVKKVVQFGRECTKLGSDLAEVQNVVDVTFGSMAGKVDKFAKSAIGTIGLSETVAKKYMGTYGAMSKAFGFSIDKAYDMSETLTKLTGDVASFYNLSTDEANTKLKSVFTGETESLKELGVVMTQTALDDFAMRKGFGKTTKSMTEQEKVALRLAFVTDKLSDASGDFARTSDGWANQTRVLALRFDALKATLGQGLINALLPAVRFLNKLMEYLQKAADAFSNFTAKVFGKQEATATATATATAGLADSLGDVATQTKAVKKAQKSLAGFDKLNVIGSASGSDAAAYSKSASTKVPTIKNNNGIEEANKAIPLIDRLKMKVKELFTMFKNGEVGQAISRMFANIGEKAKSVYENYILPAYTNIKDGFKLVVDTFALAYNKYLAPVIDNLGSKIGAVFEEHVGPMIEKALEFGGKVCELASVIWKDYLAPLVAMLGAILAPAIGFIINEAIDWISNLIDAIGDIFTALGGLTDFLTGAFTGDWKRAWQGLKTFFKGIWDSLVNIVKGPLNLIISAVNKLIRGLNRIRINIPKWARGLTGGVTSWGISIPQIPMLAQGGYVEANTPQLAMIGDNRHQGEIVAPEGKITEAVMEALGPIVAVLQQLGATIKAMQSGNGQNIVVKCILDGKVIYETVVKQNNSVIRQTGKSLLKV